MKDDYRCTYTEEATATTIKTGDGFLHAIVVGEEPTKAIEVYDSAGSGGVKLAELKKTIDENTYTFNCRFTEGLHITNPGGGKLSVIWR